MKMLIPYAHKCCGKVVCYTAEGASFASKVVMADVTS